MEYLNKSYDIIKNSNPMLKQSLEYSEGYIYWVRAKANDVASRTGLNQPLKQLEAVASMGMQRMEQKRSEIRRRLKVTVLLWQFRFSSIAFGWLRTAQDFRSSLLEGVGTMLDHAEATLEPVMLPPSTEAARYSEDPSTLTTAKRLFDVCYRLQVGTIKYSVDCVVIVFKPDTYTKLLTESRARVLVLRSEIFNHQGRLDYLEDEELTKLEIKLISVGRVVVATTEKNLQGPVRAKEALVTALSYAKGIIGQIREAKSVGDVSGIALHESRQALEVSKERIHWLQNSVLLTAAIDWMAEQEKKLQ